MVGMTYRDARDTREPDPSPADLRSICVDLVTETASLVASRRRELSARGDIRDYSMSKSSAVDPVTVVDTLAEEHLYERISELRPADGIIGEEGSDKESATGLSWIVDPIDGTVNFLYGIPHYAVSVGVARDGEVLAGAVINVVTAETYSAARGEGAAKSVAGEEHRLGATGVESLDMALVATGFGYGAQRRRRQGEIVATLLPRVRDLRRLGSAALDLCHLAEGRVDAYYENGIHCWDFAAGAIIAREAGAVVEVPPLSVSGTEGRLSLAAAPGIADAFAGLLRDAGATRPLGP
ncbi:inositol monophosphatase family protein [Corynebacterium doosanense]|uniref:Inositol-1-monophosphatase n=1 Tax=Corynebacterium doosanense CAU 212 = DSM 45436 TaxID=558173 RepID=A0A097IGL4_9CORY|nr:fructose 1,6-bisphosphatase [Corynebacterium doosanense CAU 212 = DSM 45436]